ncbi:GntR family transcriptional regulator, partial [Streptococcus pneumoniae]|uniref:GntR family transcriptional regulator n=1 Tax=Streptococcus pneumoniae TaxID=1313 RepID=UPI0013DC764A
TYRRIRHGIVFGELRPGEKLRLDRLRQHYQTSVSTLRELLSRLSAEGLVHAEGQRGFEVAPVSAKDLREVAD